MAEKPDRDTPREESTDEVPSGAESTVEASTGEKPHRRLPTWLALVIEFFTMSRTTLILLIVFLLTAALYGVVRQDPVVAINTPPRPDTTQSETTDTDRTDTDATTSGDATDETAAPTSDADPTGTDTPETSVPADQRSVDQPDVTTGTQPTQTTGPQRGPQGQQTSQNQQTQQTQQPQLTQ